MDTRWLGHALRHLERCGSTNDEASTWARAGAPHGAVVIADAQDRGRGRLGRAWHSPPGESLYFSAVLRPELDPRLLPPLVLALGVGLYDAVAETGARPDLKWPNDLLLDGRKLAGMLTEMSTAGSRVSFVIAGIGVNLNNRAFPPPLDATATSLALALGRDFAPADFARRLCHHLEPWCDRFFTAGAAPILDAWRARTRLLGRPVTVVQPGTSPVHGVAEDVADDGTLIVRRDDGELVHVVAGDVLPDGGA